MITKNEIRRIRSLHNRKGRDEEQHFIAEGPKIAAELLSSGWPVEKVFALESWIRANPALMRIVNCPVDAINGNELGRISAHPTPNQVLVVAKTFPRHPEIEKPEGINLILDSISDPGNLGTIVRIADWFGVGQIFCSEDTVDIYNPKVIQSSMSSFLRVRVHYCSLLELLSKFRDEIPVYGATIGGQNLYETEKCPDLFLLIGNESRGISPGLKPLIHYNIKIPSYPHAGGQSGAESLNAAIATSVVLAEFRRESDQSSLGDKSSA
ncbi:MAG: RNA methyltransferase [Bacteroidetes bacterium]|nr:RNA methyltransferase [Bacteroidota bacterium]MBU1720585.1 RNA methyltransferase [Bacteroidota bacterium]